MLDKIARSKGVSVTRTSLLLAAVLTAAAVPCLVCAFLSTSKTVFYLGMVLGELLLFATTSPVNGVFLWWPRPLTRT
jgi:hypothetical protein